MSKLADEIGIIIFNEIEKEELRIKKKNPSFRFNVGFKFKLAASIREKIKESENGDRKS